MTAIEEINSLLTELLDVIDEDTDYCDVEDILFSIDTLQDQCAGLMPFYVNICKSIYEAKGSMIDTIAEIQDMKNAIGESLLVRI